MIHSRGRIILRSKRRSNRQSDDAAGGHKKAHDEPRGFVYLHPSRSPIVSKDLISSRSPTTQSSLCEARSSPCVGLLNPSANSSLQQSRHYPASSAHTLPRCMPVQASATSVGVFRAKSTSNCAGSVARSHTNFGQLTQRTRRSCRAHPSTGRCYGRLIVKRQTVNCHPNDTIVK